MAKSKMSRERLGISSYEGVLLSEDLSGLAYIKTKKDLKAYRDEGIPEERLLLASDIRATVYLVSKHMRIRNDLSKDILRNATGTNYAGDHLKFDRLNYNASTDTVTVSVHRNANKMLPEALAREHSGFPHCGRILHPVYLGYKDDLEKGSGRELKWRNALAIKSFLLRHEDISLERFLTDALKPQGASHKRIVEVASNVTVAMRPPEIVFCEKPEDYVEMYASGPSSCMSTNSSNYAANAERWKDLIANGHVPASWYHYIPGIRGVFMRKQGKVAARTIVCDDTMQYGRVYSSTSADGSVLTNEMGKRGYQSIAMEDIIHKESFWFSIPGVFSKDNRDYLCPLPYVDNYRNATFGVTFDIPTKTFKFKYVASGDDKGWKNDGCSQQVELTSTSGILMAKSVLSIVSTCSVCGRRSTTGFSTPAGEQLCGETCMGLAGYARAYGAHGQRIVVRKDTCVHSAGSSRYYTNLGAMEAIIRAKMYPWYAYPTSEWCGKLYNANYVMWYEGELRSFSETFYYGVMGGDNKTWVSRTSEKSFPVLEFDPPLQSNGNQIDW